MARAIPPGAFVAMLVRASVMARLQSHGEEVLVERGGPGLVRADHKDPGLKTGAVASLRRAAVDIVVVGL
eukprot:scaffold12080_cov67-Phaeocystis_antarctica.AAC.7